MNITYLELLHKLQGLTENELLQEVVVEDPQMKEFRNVAAIERTDRACGDLDKNSLYLELR